MENKALITPREAAAMLGVGPKLVIRLVRTGKLPGVRLGYRSYRIPVHAVEQLVQSAYDKTKNPVTH